MCFWSTKVMYKHICLKREDAQKRLNQHVKLFHLFVIYLLKLPEAVQIVCHDLYNHNFYISLNEQTVSKAVQALHSMGLGPNLSQFMNKMCYIPKASKFYVKNISMLTCLKVSSLACKCVYYIMQRGDPK